MGHYSAGFTFSVYGHLMEELPRRQVEWIDELVYPEGPLASLVLPLDGAPQDASGCSPVQSAKSLKRSGDEASGSLVQSGATGYMAGGGGFEPPLTGPEPVVLPLDDPPAKPRFRLYHGPKAAQPHYSSSTCA